MKMRKMSAMTQRSVRRTYELVFDFSDSIPCLTLMNDESKFESTVCLHVDLATQYRQICSSKVDI